MNLLWVIIVGIVAGWLGSTIYKGRGLGTIGNFVVGVIGSGVGYWMLGIFGITLGSGFIGSVLTGAIGAITILFIMNALLSSHSSNK